MSRRFHQFGAALALASVLATGCSQQQPRTNFQNEDMAYYRDVATQIETPDVDTLTLDEVTFAQRPLSLENYDNYDFWEVSLEEAVKTALANSKVVRQLNYGAGPAEGGALVAGASETLLRSPDSIRTVYDPALQETSTGGGFGGIGVEAALAAFDAQLSSSVTWNRNERPVNTGGIGQAIFATNFNQDLGTYSTQLSKQTATGTSFFVQHNVNYELNNNPTRGVPSDWNTSVALGFNQPLLQGWGTQFNRVAGPNSAPGFYRGVVIARINNDITLADFESGVRDQVRSVEDAYWELYVAYRAFDSARKGRDSVLGQWNQVKTLKEFELAGAVAESQARAEYYRFRAAMEGALNQVFRAEKRLRYLMGLAPTDGRLIRPSDEPTTASIAFDWTNAQYEMLARTVELRRQKWRVKQRELELGASKNFLLPRLDASGQYSFLGAGDDLIDPNGRGVFPYPGSNAFSTLTDGDYQQWQLGLNFSMSLGFRQALAGVRNAQLQLARARAQLQEQELESSHLLSEAIGNLESNYVLTQTRFNAWIAALDEVAATQVLAEQGLTVEGRQYRFSDVLRAIANAAVAETNYYRALVNYNRSITEVHFRKGSLLDYNNVYLAEGPWPGKAYCDARDQAMLRANAVPLDYTMTQPQVFSRGPYPQITGDAPLPAGVDPLPGIEEIPSPTPADGSGQGAPTPADLPMTVPPPTGSTGPTADASNPPLPAAETPAVRQASATEDLLFRPAASATKVEQAGGALKVSSSPQSTSGQQTTSHDRAANPPLVKAG